MWRWGLVVVVLGAFLFGSSGQAALAASCTAAEKAAARSALSAYQKRMGKERAGYFRTHKRAVDQEKFAAKQQSKLKALRAATACVVPPVNLAPVAALAVSPAAPTAGDPVAFDGTKSTDADGTIASYSWDFGDGASATGATAIHAYLRSGAYTVTLTVTDNRGANASATQSVGVVLPNLAPVAALAVSPAASTAGDPVAFDGTKSTDADGTIASYSWDFGDGASATGATAIHAYLRSGAYTVTLTVTDNRGASASATQGVVVAIHPSLAFTFGAGVTEAQADDVRAGTQLARAYFAKLGTFPPRIDVRAYADAESTAQAYAAFFNTSIETARNVWVTSTAVAAKGAVFVNLGGAYWPQAKAPMRTKVLAHEVFHLVQETLAGASWSFGGGPSGIPGGGPRWLIEGAAELVGFTAAADAGLLSFATERAGQISGAKYADDVPLSTFANQAGIEAHPRAAYNLFFTAVDYLTRDVGQQPLWTFWRAIGNGQSWEAAFGATFGRSVETFYAEFESYRKTL